jgi:hypothetical protein
VRANQELPHHQQRPAIADDVQCLGQGAELVVRPHDHIIAWNLNKYGNIS